jgi:hypothetical protein
MDVERLDRLVGITGGRFRLAALVQKRMQELLNSAQGFGVTNVDGLFEKVLQEVEVGKIKFQVAPGFAPEALTAGEGKKS